MPINNLNTPLFAVAMPALSRLAGDAVRSPDRQDAWMLAAAWIDRVLVLTFDEAGPLPHQLLFNSLLHGLGTSPGVPWGFDWFAANADADVPRGADGIIVRALDEALAGLGERPWGLGARGQIDFTPLGLYTLVSMPFRPTYTIPAA